MTIPELLPPASAEAFTNDLLAKIGESTPDLIYAKDLHSRMIFANRAVLEVLGKSWDEIRGRSDDEWHDDAEEGRRFVEADARVIANGVTAELEEPLTGVHGTQIFLSSKSPLRNKDGEIIGIFGISKNITQRKNDERLREILQNELEHRVRNTLALVQAMARQTFKSAGIDKETWETFEGRLISMSKAHGLLTRESWVGAEIADVVSEGLVAHGSLQTERFEIDGPQAWVNAQTALGLAMALHELGTNAIKYGALSVPAGQVTISWSVDDDGEGQTLNFDWTERNGPPVVAPTRQGFGSRMIQQVLAQAALNGPQVQYHPVGVQFNVRLALTERIAI